jgi:hypothetical protein
VHTSKIDIQLNNTMRLFLRTVKSTQLQWLPVLVNIAPPKGRREATVRELVNCRRHVRSLLYEQMLDITITGCFPVDLCEILTLFSIPDAWTTAWSASLSGKGDLIMDSNV